MSAPKKPHVGVIGFEIFIETQLDLDTATTLEIKYKKPDGSSGTFTAVKETKTAPRSNTRYGLKYITTAVGDLDQAGDWEVQAHVVLPSGWTGPGLVAIMPVGVAL